MALVHGNVYVYDAATTLAVKHITRRVRRGKVERLLAVRVRLSVQVACELPETRAVAARALGRLGPEAKDAIPVLMNARGDPNPYRSIPW